MNNRVEGCCLWLTETQRRKYAICTQYVHNKYAICFKAFGANLILLYHSLYIYMQKKPPKQTKFFFLYKYKIGCLIIGAKIVYMLICIFKMIQIFIKLAWCYHLYRILKSKYLIFDKKISSNCPQININDLYIFGYSIINLSMGKIKIWEFQYILLSWKKYIFSF